MGKTISVTIPEPLEALLQNKADIAGMSRSRFICNILLKWEEKMKQPRRPTEIPDNMDMDTVPNDCPNRDSDGFCVVFDLVCNAPQPEANTCVGCPRDGDKGGGS